MAVGFQKAKREKIWLKVLLGGASGSGKTYSALRLASGISSECGGKIAAIDTENGRIRYYANEFDFDDLQLEAPFTPHSYIEAIDSAISGGYTILIIDSMSHEWTYCYETVNKMPGNSFTNWGKVSPQHEAFMEKILQSPLHIIATVRGKDEYVLEDKDGKKVPKKIGLGYKQRDDVEYNYTVTFNLAQDTHIADATKDNTHIFEGRYEKLTEKDGANLYRWANDGEIPQEKPKSQYKKPEPTDEKQDLKLLQQEVVDLITKNGGSKNDALMEVVKTYIKSGNPFKLNDKAKLEELKSKLENYKQGE